jgi:hypothetical protein
MSSNALLYLRRLRQISRVRLFAAGILRTQLRG